MTETWYIIANPAANGGKAYKKHPKVKALLEEEGFDFEWVETRAVGHAQQLVEEGLKKGYRKIIAVGGDGTGHEVVNGIFEQHIVPVSEIIYTIISVGTGNDWIKEYGIPKDYRRWIPQIKKAQPFQQDIGLAHYTKEDGSTGSRYFLNVAGMAYDAFVARYMLQSEMPFSNKIIYLFLIFKCLFAYTLRKAKVFFDGQEAAHAFYTVNVGLCRYSGGGMQFVPHAKPNDGQFALTYAKELSKVGVMLATPYFYNGKVDKHPKVEVFQAKKIRVEALEDTPTLLELDGDYVGHTPVEFELLPKALTVLIP